MKFTNTLVLMKFKISPVLWLISLDWKTLTALQDMVLDVSFYSSIKIRNYRHYRHFLESNSLVGTRFFCARHTILTELQHFAMKPFWIARNLFFIENLLLATFFKMGSTNDFNLTLIFELNIKSYVDSEITRSWQKNSVK